ncbi:MAG TPA: M15 family metallopeptidase [Treponemataceae bacterium]|nr:M15 family metallopeptidase [Treponemataceae bacterium]
MKKTVCLVCVSLVAFFAFAAGKGSADAAAFSAPDSIPKEMLARIDSNKAAFDADLDAALKADAAGGNALLTLVDKRHALSANAVPADLVALAQGKSYAVGRGGLSLRSPAERALDAMARAARADGVTLVASSTYRSFEYQKKIYERNVREMGELAASRESAKPGQSQHQLGTAVDFGSITDDFAGTKAGKWLAAHAGEYGWSLSFPKGLEPVTGYRWECWHYRYIGKEAVALADRWFGGVQQYMIEYVAARRAKGN